MIIQSLKLKNWRNFLTVDVELGKRVFLIGPNASGKSNFLDVFKFLRDIAKPGGGLQKAVSDRGGLSKIRCLAARKEPQVEIEVKISNINGSSTDHWRYAVGFKQQSRGHRQPYIEYERVYKNDVILLNRPEPDDLKDDLRLTQTHLEQINANTEFRDIARFFESFYYMHLIPQLLRHPSVFTGSLSKEDPYGRLFLERVAKTPEPTRKARLRKIEEALKVAVPQLKRLTDAKDESGIPHLEAMYDHWRPNAGKQSEEEFSDGTLRLIGLLWLLMEGDSLLLLEEPELSLNTYIVSRLPGMMWRIQNKKKRQIIISTHSPELLSDKGIDAGEVLLLTPNSEGTRVQVASSLSEIKDLIEGGMSVGEAVLPYTEPENLDQLRLFDV